MSPLPTAAPRYRRALVVANPIAGRGRGVRAATALVEGLERLGVVVDLHLTQRRGDGELAVRGRDASIDLVVSVGGDGTLGEVLTGLGSDPGGVAVAQLPLGTANVLAHDLRLPTRVERSLEIIASGRERLLDTALVNGRLTFLCVGVGIDGYAVEEVETRRTGPITKLSYVTAMFRALRRYRAPRLKVVADGQELEGRFGFVLISNVRGYGAVFRLSKACRHDDALVEVYAVRRAGFWALVRTAVRGVLGRLPGPDGEFVQAARVRVESDEPVPYQVDGDFGGRGTVDYALTGSQVRIVAP